MRLTGRDLDQRALDDAMIALDGTADQESTGRKRPARRVDGRASVRKRRPTAAALSARRRDSTATSALTLPVPMMNILNGGAHADSSVDFQEFMVMPRRRRLVCRGAAGRRRDLPRAARHPERTRAVDRRR